jgi:hypothetical protein
VKILKRRLAYAKQAQQWDAIFHPINENPENIYINNRKGLLQSDALLGYQRYAINFEQNNTPRNRVFFATITKALSHISRRFVRFPWPRWLLMLIGIPIPNAFTVFSLIRPRR